MEGSLRRKQHPRGRDAEGPLNQVPVPVNLADDVLVRDQGHQGVEEAEGGKGDARVAEGSGGTG